MSDRDHRDPWDLRRLGDEDFVARPLDASEWEPGHEPDPPAGMHPPQRPGRRMRPDERAELRQRARQKRELPPEYFGHTSSPAPRRRWPRWGGAALILTIIIIAGNIGLLRDRDGGSPATPTAPVSPTVEVIAVSDSPTTPPDTPTPEATATPSPEPTPTPEPTPDPRFSGLIVCLDPGHGGSDRGYERSDTEAAPALQEAPLNLEIALAVAERLEAYGFSVVLTRTDDVEVNADGADVNGDGKTLSNQTGREAESAEARDELQARINVCNEADADLLVSLHVNGYPDPEISGVETWYSASRPFAGLNKLIASLIYDELLKGYKDAGYNVTERGVRDDSTVNAGSHQDLFDSYVITGPAQPGAIVASQMPGTIAEALFISSEHDAPILASANGRQVIVDAYVRAILAYFNTILGPNGRAD